MNRDLYFEKQEKLMCGLHSLNNLFGYKVSNVNALINVANDIISRNYYSEPRKISYDAYVAKYQPRYYDCVKGFFSPNVQISFINSFTDYTLKTIKTKQMNDIDIINYAIRYKKQIHGFLLSVAKKYKTSNKRYNHSIAIRLLKKGNKLAVVLLDSELDRPILLTKDTCFFTGPGKLYSINMIQKLIKKTKNDTNNQASSLIMDLIGQDSLNTLDKDSKKGFKKILTSIKSSPNLINTMERKITKPGMNII